MTEQRNIAGVFRFNGMRFIVWAGATALMLLVPLIAMQFTDEVDWTAGDFVFAGALILGTGLVYETATAMRAGAAYRLAIGIALAGGFLLIWIGGAVGIVDSEDSPANLLYGAVLAAGLAGAIVSRFEPQGMARALYAVALVNGLVAAIVLPAGPRTLVLNGVFVALWLVSAALFGKAARQS